MDINNEYGTLEMQKCLLVLMQAFDAFCIKNDIKYSMGGGSMLGAIRENGFIPWDDDLDINLDRDNYNKLLKLIRQDYEFKVFQHLWVYRVTLSRYASLDMENVPTLDLFVLDNIPDNAMCSKIKVLIIKVLQGMMKRSGGSGNYSLGYKILSFITMCVGRLFPLVFLSWIYDKVSQWGNRHHTQYATFYDSLFKYLTKKYESDLMQELIRHPFENIEVYVSKGYHNYLTTLYGDYMTPPDKSERNPQHLKKL